MNCVESKIAALTLKIAHLKYRLVEGQDNGPTRKDNALIGDYRILFGLKDLLK